MNLTFYRYFLYAFFSVAVFMALGFHTTYSFFSDAAVSGSNTFSAASVFPTVTISTTPSDANQPGDVVINEINWAGNNTTIDDEWLELKNTSGSPVDVSGWKLEGAASGIIVITIPSGIIPANGFFLISNFDSTTSKVNVSPDFVTATLQLDNTSLKVVLKTASDIIMDSADDGTSIPAAGINSPLPKKSMERITPPGDGTQSANWQNASTHTNMDLGGPTDEFGTPKSTNGL